MTITYDIKQLLSSNTKTLLRLKPELIPMQHTGSVLSLPLIFEISYTAAQIQKESLYSRFFEVVSNLDLQTLLEKESKLPGRVKLYPIFSEATGKIELLPQLIRSDSWSTSSTDISAYAEIANPMYYAENDQESELIGFPNIVFKALTNANAYYISSTDLAIFDKFGSDNKFYSIPSVETYNFNTHLRTQIYTRYYRPSTINDGNSAYGKIVLDTFLPFLAIHDVPNSSNSSEITYNPSRYIAISPFTASLLNIDQIPIHSILKDVLNFDLTHIETLLKTVKKAKLKIIFAGVGGTGTNTIYWLNEICKFFDITNIFDEVYVYEKDNVDFSNIFRFPISPKVYESINAAELPKIALVDRYLRTLSKYIIYKEQYLESHADIPNILLDENSQTKSDVIVYGAPSISNRNFLSSLGSFISATHANNTASLYINPKADDSLQVETYGLIQLNSFFINQIRMAIGFLEILSEKAYRQEDLLWSDYTFTPENTQATKYFFNISREMQALVVGE